MSKLDKIALYAIKEYTKEQERKRKAAEKEAIRFEKERQKQEEISEKRKEYEAWLQEEEAWLGIFDGNLGIRIRWEEKLVPRPYQEPEAPKTDHLVGEAVSKVKETYRNRMSFALISLGVLLYYFYYSQGIEELLTTAVGSLILTFVTILISMKRGQELTRAVENALAEKSKLEEEFNRFKEESKNEYELKERERLEKIEALLRGDHEAVKKTALRYLKRIPFPKEVSFEVDYTYTDEKAELTIRVPGLEVIQNQVATWNDQKGTIKYSPKPQKEILRQYERYLAALVLRSGWEIFRVCPKVKEVYLSVLTQKRHRTKGHSCEACILSCVMAEAVFQEIDFKQVEYINALENFQLRYSSREKEMPGDVRPYEIKRQLDLNEEDILQLAMNGDQFEDFVKALVDKMGLQTEKTKKSHDGGIDIWAYDNNALAGGRYIIQCKRWKQTIPAEIVRELYGAVAKERADKGILITTSRISSDCYKWVENGAYKVPITLISGAELRKLITQYGLVK